MHVISFDQLPNFENFLFNFFSVQLLINGHSRCHIVIACEHLYSIECVKCPLRPHHILICRIYWISREHTFSIFKHRWTNSFIISHTCTHIYYTYEYVNNSVWWFRIKWCDIKRTQLNLCYYHMCVLMAPHVVRSRMSECCHIEAIAVRIRISMYSNSTNWIEHSWKVKPWMTSSMHTDLLVSHFHNVRWWPLSLLHNTLLQN